MNELPEELRRPTVLLSHHPPRPTTSGYQQWMLLAVFVIAALLWICVAARSGLWVDEVFSLAMATGHSLEHPAAAADPREGDFVEPDHPVPAKDFQRYLKHDSPPASPARVVRAVFLSDTNPPLYYLLLYSWTLVFGTSDFALRLFSIACSLACLPLLVGIARSTGGKEAVFASCVLFAFSPLAIYYSTEGRMYSLLWVFVLATTWTSLVLQERGGGIGMYALWIVASAAGFLTHYFFVFPWLAVIAYLLIRPGKLARLKLAGCLFLTAMVILPWYLHIPECLAGWRITKDWLKRQPMGFNRLAALREIVLQSFSGRSRLWWQNPHGRSNIVALILFGIVAIAMVWRLGIRAFGGQLFLLWLLFVAGCATPLAFDLMQHTYTTAYPRYAIAALPAAYLLAAAGLACLDRRIRLIILILIIVSWVPDISSIYHDRFPWLPIREISRVANENTSRSDLILVHSIPSGVLGIARYAGGPAALASWIGQLGTRRMPDSLHALIDGRKRVVFVKVHQAGEPAPEENWLRANAVVFRETRLGSGRIVDFRPVNSEKF
jgi:Dolichyl-phosphate-mannose-protein mannosyltransferase